MTYVANVHLKTDEYLARGKYVGGLDCVGQKPAYQLDALADNRLLTMDNGK